MEVHRSQPYTCYVAYASGGIWKTDPNGVRFTPLADALPTTISGDITIDPNNPDTIWVGTGEPDSSRSSYSGVFISRDGGQSFAQSGLLGADRIARVMVDPRDGRRVFVAVLGPRYTEGGRGPAPDGIHSVIPAQAGIQCFASARHTVANPMGCLGLVGGNIGDVRRRHRPSAVARCARARAGGSRRGATHRGARPASHRAW
jgi:hypothetical protein